MKSIARLVVAAVLVGQVWLPCPAAAQTHITKPEQFFGFPLGADRKMARWDRIVEYLAVLEKESGGRMKVVNMGPTTMGNPFLVVIVSARNNIARLDRLREINSRLSDPRGLAESAVAPLVAEGRAVVCQSMSLHASEIGGTQMAPELIYDLLARDDEETHRILDNVLSFIVPSFNPDGNIMVADYYNKTLGTEYEGSVLPWLFNKYVGHDNNRDAFQANMVESQYMAKLMLRDWVPQAYVDHHQQYSYGARIYLPPYAEPIRPYADPLVWRELSWYGSHMSYREEAAGESGSLNGATYPGWGHFGFNWMTPFHNIAGMLTESAHAKMATPIYIHPEQLQGSGRGLPAYEPQTNFPNPWPGGWWRLRDVVDRQKIAAWAVLDLAARNKDTVLWNAYYKARRQTERGAAGKPVAYAIPATQHDRLTAVLMVNKLLGQGIEVQEAPEGFTTSGGTPYPAGSWLVPMAQPKMGAVRYLLGRTKYPDNDWTRSRDGSPVSPYDLATDTMYEFMGVRVDPLDDALPSGNLHKITALLQPAGKVARGSSGYSIDGRLNDSFKVLNALLAKGVAVRRVTSAGNGLRPGDFVVADAPQDVIAAAAAQTGVDFRPLNQPTDAPQVRRLRIGMYQHYRGGSTDEGWTRWLLEQYGFPYTTLFDKEIKTGALSDRYDVIILPNDAPWMITGELTAAQALTDLAYPPEYRSGLGGDGITQLKAFVQAGGTLLTMGDACRVAVEKFALALRDATAGKSSKDFFCPGSTLKVKLDATHPLAYGMPAEAFATYLGGNPAFEVLQGPHAERYETVVRYADRDLLQSGWLVGEQTLAKKAAMVVAQYGRGRVVLIGFRTQHRGQTHGTFKLLFNVLVR